MFGARSTEKSGNRSEQGLFWLKSSIRLALQNFNANQRRTEVAQPVMHICAKRETVSETIIAIKTPNSSLSLISQFYLAPRIIDAN
jgi:hypothetical protein